MRRTWLALLLVMSLGACTGAEVVADTETNATRPRTVPPAMSGSGTMGGDTATGGDTGLGGSNGATGTDTSLGAQRPRIYQRAPERDE